MEKIKVSILVEGDCGGKNCPAIYRASDGRIFVQGFVTPDEIRNQVEMASNEALVEINADLLKNLSKIIK
ncbi:MAG: hypothetical protein M0Z48_09755 [Nitrospiraceae bacterium]|nr:hypothetical protein [Nitrospiraceae bacterium]